MIFAHKVKILMPGEMLTLNDLTCIVVGSLLKPDGKGSADIEVHYLEREEPLPLPPSSELPS